MADRQALIERIMWLSEDSGIGYGIPSFGNMMMQSMMKPKTPSEDWKSVVAVKGPASKYTDDELSSLADFSDRYTADYDSRWRYRMGANLLIFDREHHDYPWLESGPVTRWLRKRQSWESGPMYSDTLEEAISRFDADIRPPHHQRGAAGEGR